MTLWPFLTLFSVTWFVSIRNVLTQLFFNDLVFVQFLVAVKGNKSFETVYKKPSVVSPPGWDVELLFSFFRLPVRAVWFLSPSLISPSDDKQYGWSIPLMLPHSCCFIVLRVAFGNCFCHLAPPSGQTWHFYSTPSEGVALTKSSWIFLSLCFFVFRGKESTNAARRSVPSKTTRTPPPVSPPTTVWIINLLLLPEATQALGPYTHKNCCYWLVCG